MKGTRGHWSDRVLPWLLGIAFVAAVVIGLRSIGSAQTGDFGRDVVPPADPGLVAAPELERDRVQVRECTHASGGAAQSEPECAPGAATAEIETVPIELAPAR